MNGKLTPKQQRFVQAYVVSLNATEAARQAGYANPNKQGPALLVNHGVAEAVAAANAKVCEKLEMQAEEALERLARVARGNILDFAQWSEGGLTFKNASDVPYELGALIKTMKCVQRRDNEGVTVERIEISLHDPVRALELIGKRWGLFADSVNLNLGGGIVDMQRVPTPGEIAALTEIGAGLLKLEVSKN